MPASSQARVLCGTKKQKWTWTICLKKTLLPSLLLARIHERPRLRWEMRCGGPLIRGRRNCSGSPCSQVTSWPPHNLNSLYEAGSGASLYGPLRVSWPLNPPHLTSYLPYEGGLQKKTVDQNILCLFLFLKCKYSFQWIVNYIHCTALKWIAELTKIKINNCIKIALDSTA